MPQTLPAAWTRRQPHPTPLSIAGVAGEVSRQRVASFFPVASHSWLGAAGSRGRQGSRPCRGTPIVSATLPSAEGSTMSIPVFQGCPSSLCQRFVNLSIRNEGYKFGKKYTRWGAVFPGNFVPVLKIEGKLPVAEGKSVPAYLALKHAGGSLSETKHRPKNGKRSDRQSHDGKPRIYLYCM